MWWFDGRARALSSTDLRLSPGSFNMKNAQIIVLTVLISLALAGCQAEKKEVVLDYNHCQKFQDVLEIQTADEEEIGEIFYSPKTESCLYTVSGPMGETAEAGALLDVHTYDWFVKWVWDNNIKQGAVSWDGNLFKAETKEKTLQKAEELFQDYR